MTIKVVARRSLSLAGSFNTSNNFSRRSVMSGSGLILTSALLLPSNRLAAKSTGGAVYDLIRAGFDGKPQLAQAEIPPKTSPEVKLTVANPTPEPQHGVVLANYTTPKREFFQDRSKIIELDGNEEVDLDYFCDDEDLLERFILLGLYALYFKSLIQRTPSLSYKVYA